MSGDSKRKDNKSSDGGLGLGAALLVGAGAAAVGFLARDMWNLYQETSGSFFTPSHSAPSSNSTTTSDWEGESDKKLGRRKKQRDAFRDQNVPDELKCTVCIDNPREICLIPCGHVCVCEDCAEKIGKKCPICSQYISNKKVVYM